MADTLSKPLADLLKQVKSGGDLPDDPVTRARLGTLVRLGRVEHSRDDKGDHWKVTGGK